MLRLRYRDQVISVMCAAPELVDWLRSFLSPPFVVHDEPGAVTVEVTVDAARYAALRDGGQPAGDEVDLFTFDQGQPRLPRWSDGGVHDPASGVFLHRDGVRLLVVAAADDRRSRMFLARLVRELATAEALAAGDVHLHGSAAADGDAVTVAVGPKGAGKSTFLLHALSHPGVAYVSNDRVLVARDGIARGVPTITRLRDETFRFFPALAGRLQGRRVSPRELREATGAAELSEGRTARLVCLRVDADTPRFTITRLAPDEAAARLLRDGLIAGGSSAGFFARPDRPPIEEAVRALVTRIPCYAVNLGVAAYEPPTVWTALSVL